MATITAVDFVVASQVETEVCYWWAPGVSLAIVMRLPCRPLFI